MPKRKDPLDFSIPYWMKQENVWEKRSKKYSDLLRLSNIEGPVGEAAKRELERIDPKWSFVKESLEELKRSRLLGRRQERYTEQMAGGFTKFEDTPVGQDYLRKLSRKGERDIEPGFFTPGESSGFTSKEMAMGLSHEGSEIDWAHAKGSLSGLSESQVARGLKQSGMEAFEIKLENEAEKLERESGVAWSKFKKEYSFQRGKYFEGIAPERFSPEMLKRVGIERKRGKWFKHIIEREFGQSTSMPLQNIPLERQAYLGAAETRLEELAPGEFGKMMAQYEMQLYYKPLSGTGATEKMVSKVDRMAYLRNMSDIVTGQSKSSVHFLTPEAQAAHAGEFFDQWAYLKDPKGNVVPLGKHRIIGRVNPILEEDFAAAADRLISTKNKAAAVRKMIGTYHSLASSAIQFDLDDAFLRKIRSLIEPMYKNRGRRSYLWNLNEGFMTEKLRIRDINSRIFERNTRKIFELLRKRTSVSKLNLVTYQQQLDYINKLTEGEVLLGTGGRRFTVARPEHAGHITLGEGTWRDAQILEEQLLKKNTFPVRFVRTSRDDLGIISIIDPTGTEVGRLNKSLAETLMTGQRGEVSYGMLPEFGTLGRVSKTEEGAFKLELLKKGAETEEDIARGLIPNVPTMYENKFVNAYVGRAEHQEALAAIFERELKPNVPVQLPLFKEFPEVTPGIDESKFNWLVNTKWPLESAAGRPLTLAERMERIRTGVSGAFDRTIDIGERLINKRMVTVAAVTAGALLLWGATKQRSNVPLMVERDVPRSLYGSQNLDSKQIQPMYTPRARVTPENTGYNLDMDISTEDSGKNIDHSQLARSLRSISSSALGHNRVESSLRITDDSSDSDQRTITRRVNEALRK